MAQDNFNYFKEDDGRSLDSESSSVETFDIQHYLRIVRKRKWPISVFTAAVTALAIYYAYTATPIYSATSTLLIEEQKANVPSIDELYGVDTKNVDYYQTQFEILKSRKLAKRVITHLDLWNNPELSAPARKALAREESAKREALGLNDEPSSFLGGITSWLEDAGIVKSEIIEDQVSDTVEMLDDSALTSLDESQSGELQTSSADSMSMSGNVATGDAISNLEQEREIVISNFMGRLSITPVRKTKLVKIAFESADPALAAIVANTVGEQYIESYLDAKLEMTEQASTWLNKRLTALKVTLVESKARLISFKKANGLVDVGGIGRLNEQELLLLTADLSQARSDLSDSADIYRDVQSLRSNPDLLETVPGVQADPLVQRVKIEQGQAQRQLDELLNRYGERHPRVVDAKSQLSTLNNTLQGHVRRVVNSIEKDYRLRRQRVAAIEAKLSSGKQEIQDIGAKKFELDALEREVATNQDIHDTFFSSISQSRSADGMETANARISDAAVTPVGAIKPKKQLIIALAALASLVLSMLMAFLYEQMDDTVKSTNDIEGKLGLKLLGILPLVKGGFFARKENNLPLNPADITDKHRTFSEAVNTVRTSLCMDEHKVPRKVMVVTSSVPGEGKSTTSINMAHAFAQIERVLLVDCDMRRPTIAKAAGLDRNVPGLSNLITNTAPARECIKRGAFGAVDILPSGPLPDQPLELLSSKRFARILQQLGQHYDRIVIDSAPTQAVSDALVLSSMADAVIYVVKSHETSIELVKRGVQRLSQVNAPLAGVVISQVDMDKITAYGGDYYYQGYYDYYGYTEKGSKTRHKGQGKMRLTQEELMDIRTDDGSGRLDLDFVNEGFEPEAGAKPINGNGTATNGYSSADLEESEFDMTAQIDMPIERIRRDMRNNGQSAAKRYPDDLDII